MNGSERTDPEIDVEDDQSVKQASKVEEIKVKEGPKALKLVENDARDTGNSSNAASQDAGDEMDADGDSEAETLIQSPEKKRNSVADGSTIVHPVKLAGSDAGSIIIANTSDKENATRKRKRPQEDGNRESPSRASSHRSSPLSSPLAQVQSDVDSDDSAASNKKTSPKRHNSDTQDKIQMPKKRRRRPSEIVPPSPSHKRSKRNSVDAVERRETRSATYPRPSDDEKSPSPEPIARREHRRGASTQLTTGEFERRKRGRPPLINTRRNRSADRASNSSDESEPRSSRNRPHLSKLTSADNETMSPAKVGPRKWKDKNGRTYLARACANNDLEAARSRLAERPEDLNIGDNAGNTPLQISSLEGFETIVEFLLLKGADVNIRNVDKDTPLIDAVENGHVEVIKLLLKHGANPRMGNAKGDEPYELVHPDDEAYGDIRELLAEAKDKDAKKTPGVEAFDLLPRDGASSRAASAASPRDSPPIGPRSPPAFGSRRRTGRSESTRNDLLWQANTQENLAKLASKGDVQGVANILSILEKAETESLIAAAKAGHEEVLQLLIAMGKPDPDPDPVRSSKMVPGYNTPILAAIGRGHPDVVKLLAHQTGFDPTRKHRDKTYYELADDRRGDRWEEEYNILKAAYERKKGKKMGSPRKTRDQDRAKPRRRSSSVNSAKRPTSSPSSAHKSLPGKNIDSPAREKRKISDSTLDKPKTTIDAAESTIAVASDIDQTVNAQKKVQRTRRSQSDLPPLPGLESEQIYKRRRLVTGKEHRSRQNVGTSSDNEDSDMPEVKQEERPQSALKRSRVSSTPDPPGDGKDRKKRRTVLESSPDDIKSRTSLPSEPSQPAPSVESVAKDVEVKAKAKRVQNEVVENSESVDQAKPSTNEIKIESPAHDVNPTRDPELLPDAAEDSDDHYSPPPAAEPPEEEIAEAERKAKEEAEMAEKAAAEAAAEEAARQEAERIAEAERKAKEERKAQEEQEAREKAAEEARLKQEAEERQRREEEEEARRRQEEERQERLKQELESRRRLEQLERERKRLEALPIVLAKTAQMIDDNDPEVRSPQWLSKFLPLYTVKTRQLDPNCDPTVADDDWVPNFQVACLLLTKDLKLLNFTSFEKRLVTAHERQCIWRVARLRLSYDFNPLWTTTVSKANEIELVAQEKFMSMDELFWVKLSDFIDQIPRFPHLGLQLTRQPISLKSYNEILGTQMKTGIYDQHASLANGIVTYGNGENGIT